MTNRERYIVLALWLTALAIALRYAFGTSYLTVSDAARDLYLYNAYLMQPGWGWHMMETITGEYGLQNTTLLSTYIPAILARILRVTGTIAFFKIYTALAVSFVPVVAYFISRQLVGRYAIVSAAYVMGWVAFYQGTSLSRLNFAMLAYGGLLLILLSTLRERVKVPLLVALSVTLTLTHYGSALVTILLVGGLFVWLAFRKEYRQAFYIGAVVVSLVVSYGLWQHVINRDVWSGIAQPDYARQIGVVINPALDSPRDKITQAAFGSSDPDNDTTFHRNRWLLLSAWVTVMLMLYGAWLIVHSSYSNTVKGLTVLSLLSIGLIVALPWASRAYGLEKVFYQAIILTGSSVVVGGQDLARRLRVPALFLLSVVVVPYVWLMWQFGIITSVLGE